ncbi:hypothetical protein BJF78_27855 [Pseudonocardia sp. CNS-139]|nr:hypothetical protein BJF78_27855 [Pseudonocardia sp. CNS-139]
MEPGRRGEPRVNLFAEVLAWFGDPEHWQGSGGVPELLLEHLVYTVQAIALGVLVAVPLGAVIGHTGRGGFLLVGVANGLRAMPELGLLILLVLLTGIGLLPLTVTCSCWPSRRCSPARTRACATSTRPSSTRRAAWACASGRCS